MNEDTFSTWLDKMQSALDAFGSYVTSAICTSVEGELGRENTLNFFKTTPKYRVKEKESALNKLKTKKYERPTEQMTDLVGTRFVVLLKTDIEFIDSIILSNGSWVATRERHFENEIYDDPAVFDYQSVHYIVRPVKEFVHNATCIPESIVCEIQVRTILQHAYAELVHSNIYKPKVKIPNTTKRKVARCMALIEAADELFVEAVEEIDGIAKSYKHVLDMTNECYINIGPVISSAEEDARLIFHTYRELFKDLAKPEIESLAATLPIRTRIKDRAAQNNLFGLPMCLLVYWLIMNHHSFTLRHWPLEIYRTDVEQICSDLGYSAY